MRCPVDLESRGELPPTHRLANHLADRRNFAAIAFEILLILFIDYSHIGNLIYGTAPISWQVWLFVVPFARGMLLLEELRKWWMRRKITLH